MQASKIYFAALTINEWINVKEVYLIIKSYSNINNSLFSDGAN